MNMDLYLLKRARTHLLSLALGFAALAAPHTASANTIWAPYAPSSLDVYIAQVFDPAAVIVRPAAISVRKRDGACTINLFTSDQDGFLTETPYYNSSSGDDTISFWSDPNWSWFTCGQFTVAVKSLNPNGFIPEVRASWGNDIVLDSLFPTRILLQDGNDIVDIENQSFAVNTVVLGGWGHDIFHLYSENVIAVGEGGDDLFCMHGVVPDAILGGPGNNFRDGTAKEMEPMPQLPWPCPAGPR